MLARVIALLFILNARLLFGGLLSNHCQNGQRIRLVSQVISIDQKVSKEISLEHGFYFSAPLKQQAFVGNQVEVVGICKRKVIDFLESRTELTSVQMSLPSNVLSSSTNSFGKHLDNFRMRLVKIFSKRLPQNEAALAAGMALGDDSQLSYNFKNKLIQTGTIHILVASGYNVALLAGWIIAGMIKIVKRPWANIISLILLFGYAMLTGLEPPVTRAWLMLTVALLVQNLGRKLPVWYVLFLSVWLVIMISPVMITSISFQLSAAATAGLIGLEPLICIYLNKNRITRHLEGLHEEMASTFAAQIATAPLLLFYFGRLSLIAPLVNVLILPFVPLVTVMAIIQLGLNIPFGGMVSLLTYCFAHPIVVIVNLFSHG